MKYLIGTRGSKLAMAQAEQVKNTLQGAFPQHQFELCVIRTKGDKILDKPLSQIGGKGLFVKEIEEQILSEKVDIGVHSMKDMPSEPAEGLVFTTPWKREDARDVLITREKKSLQELSAGAILGTGSLRRQVQIRQLRPDIETVNIRGNVDTRLKKMEEQKLDGIILAAAGLHRLKKQDCISQYFTIEEMLPAPAQGVLALEIRKEDTELKEMLNQFRDAESAFCAKAEREFLSLSGGDCHTPVGAVCERKSEECYQLYGGLWDNQRKEFRRDVVEGTDAIRMAKTLWEKIRSDRT